MLLTHAALFIFQHARLNLFRYFASFSTKIPVSNRLRTFCLQQSMLVSKTTASILYRGTLHPNFLKLFGVRTDDLVHLHTFRVAVMILMGLQMPNLSAKVSVNEDDLYPCLYALQAIARVYITGQKYPPLSPTRNRFITNPTGS